MTSNEPIASVLNCAANSAPWSTRLCAITVCHPSDVEVTRDLDWATVWVTALLPEQSKDAVKALNQLAFEFRRTLSRQMRLRRVPELRFKYDDSVDKGERIEHLLRQDSIGPVSEDGED